MIDWQGKCIPNSSDLRSFLEVRVHSPSHHGFPRCIASLGLSAACFNHLRPEAALALVMRNLCHPGRLHVPVLIGGIEVIHHIRHCSDVLRVVGPAALPKWLQPRVIHEPEHLGVVLCIANAGKVAGHFFEHPRLLLQSGLKLAEPP